MITDVLLVVSIQLLLQALGHWTYTKWAPGYRAIIVGPCFIASAAIAELVCRRRGITLVRSETDLFVGPVLDCVDLPPAEVRALPDRWRALALLLGGLAALILLVLHFAKSAPGSEIYGYGMAVGSAIGALLCWLAGAVQPAVAARADDAGVTYSSGFRYRFMAWDRIESCEITMRSRVLCDLDSALVLLNGAGGEPAAKISIVGPNEQVAGFVRYLASKFADRRALPGRNRVTTRGR